MNKDVFAFLRKYQPKGSRAKGSRVGIFVLLLSLSLPAIAFARPIELDSPEQKLNFLLQVQKKVGGVFEKAAQFDVPLFELLESQNRLAKNLASQTGYLKRLEERPYLNLTFTPPAGGLVLKSRSIKDEAIQSWRRQLKEMIGQPVDPANGVRDLAQLIERATLPMEVDQILAVHGRKKLWKDVGAVEREAKLGTLKSCHAAKEQGALAFVECVIKHHAILEGHPGLPTLAQLEAIKIALPSEQELKLWIIRKLVEEAEGLGPVPTTPQELISRIERLDSTHLSAWGDVDYLQPKLKLWMGAEAFAQSFGPGARLVKDIHKSAHQYLSQTEGKDEKHRKSLTLEQQCAEVAAFRGFLGGDCSSKTAYGTPNDPNERVFFIRGPEGDLRGYVLAIRVQIAGTEKHGLYVMTINGPQLSSGDTELILRGLESAKSEFAVDEVLLPSASQVGNEVGYLTNYVPIWEVFKAYSKKAASVGITYLDSSYRKAIESVTPNPVVSMGMNSKGILLPAKSAAKVTYTSEQARPFSVDPQIKYEPGEVVELFLGLLASGRKASLAPMLALGSVNGAGITMERLESVSSLIRNCGPGTQEASHHPPIQYTVKEYRDILSTLLGSMGASPLLSRPNFGYPGALYCKDSYSANHIAASAEMIAGALRKSRYATDSSAWDFIKNREEILSGTDAFQALQKSLLQRAKQEQDESQILKTHGAMARLGLRDLPSFKTLVDYAKGLPADTTQSVPKLASTLALKKLIESSSTPNLSFPGVAGGSGSLLFLGRYFSGDEKIRAVVTHSVATLLRTNRVQIGYGIEESRDLRETIYLVAKGAAQAKRLDPEELVAWLNVLPTDGYLQDSKAESAIDQIFRHITPEVLNTSHRNALLRAILVSIGRPSFETLRKQYMSLGISPEETLRLVKSYLSAGTDEPETVALLESVSKLNLLALNDEGLKRSLLSYLEMPGRERLKKRAAQFLLELNLSDEESKRALNSVLSWQSFERNPHAILLACKYAHLQVDAEAQIQKALANAPSFVMKEVLANNDFPGRQMVRSFYDRSLVRHLVEYRTEDGTSVDSLLNEIDEEALRDQSVRQAILVLASRLEKQQIGGGGAAFSKLKGHVPWQVWVQDLNSLPASDANSSEIVLGAIQAARFVEGIDFSSMKPFLKKLQEHYYGNMMLLVESTLLAALPLDSDVQDLALKLIMDPNEKSKIQKYFLDRFPFRAETVAKFIRQADDYSFDPVKTAPRVAALKTLEERVFANQTEHLRVESQNSQEWSKTRQFYSKFVEIAGGRPSAHFRDIDRHSFLARWTQGWIAGEIDPTAAGLLIRSQGTYASEGYGRDLYWLLKEGSKNKSDWARAIEILKKDLPKDAKRALPAVAQLNLSVPQVRELLNLLGPHLGDPEHLDKAQRVAWAKNVGIARRDFIPGETPIAVVPKLLVFARGADEELSATALGSLSQIDPKSVTPELYSKAYQLVKKPTSIFSGSNPVSHQALLALGSARQAQLLEAPKASTCQTVKDALCGRSPEYQAKLVDHQNEESGYSDFDDWSDGVSGMADPVVRKLLQNLTGFPSDQTAAAAHALAHLNPLPEEQKPVLARIKRIIGQSGGIKNDRHGRSTLKDLIYLVGRMRSADESLYKLIYRLFINRPGGPKTSPTSQEEDIGLDSTLIWTLDRLRPADPDLHLEISNLLSEDWGASDELRVTARNITYRYLARPIKSKQGKWQILKRWLGLAENAPVSSEHSPLDSDPALAECLNYEQEGPLHNEQLSNVRRLIQAGR